MIESIIFIISFMWVAAGLLLYPRREQRENVVTIIPVVVLTILCIQMIGVLILEKLSIAITLKSSMWILILVGSGLWLGIIRRKKFQALICPWRDVLLLGLAMMIVLMEAFHMFAGVSRLSYRNDDAQAFFGMAQQVVRGKTLQGLYNGTYFNAYMNALLIELGQPWLRMVDTYKMFILGDVLIHLLEIGIFYSVLAKLCRQKAVRCFLPVICLFYFLGYPTYSFMSGNFIYWSTGGVLFLYLIYSLIGLQNRWEERWCYYGMLAFGIFGSVVCNRLYAIINPLCMLFALFCIIMEKKHLLVGKSRKLVFSLVLAVVGVVVVLSHNRIWNLLMLICERLQDDGANYAVLYKEIVLFIPVVICLVVYGYRNKIASPIVGVISVPVILISAGMLWLCVQKYISVYYYYKIYYCLWIVMWLMAVTVLDTLIQEGHGFYVLSYASFVICLALNQPLVESETGDNNYFLMYRDNLKCFQMDYAGQELQQSGRYTPRKLLDDYQYLADQYCADGICFLSDSGNYMQGRWFATILNSSEEVYYSIYSSVVEYYLSGAVPYSYIVMGKQSGIYGESIALLNDINIEYEDEMIVVVRTNYGKEY